MNDKVTINIEFSRGLPPQAIKDAIDDMIRDFNDSNRGLIKNYQVETK